MAEQYQFFQAYLKSGKCYSHKMEIFETSFLDRNLCNEQILSAISEYCNSRSTEFLKKCKSVKGNGASFQINDLIAFVSSNNHIEFGKILGILFNEKFISFVIEKCCVEFDPFLGIFF